MRRRLAAAILLLYPRRVREGHGPEIVALIDDLVAHEGRSRARLFVGLAVDGLLQRVASAATVWTMVMVVAATSVGGLAVSEFAAAHALHGVPRTTHNLTPAGHASGSRHPAQVRASSTRFRGVSAARRTEPKPPSSNTSRRRASPACVPRPARPGCEREPGVQTSVENP